MKIVSQLLVRGMVLVALLPPVAEATAVRVDFAGNIEYSAGVLAGTTGSVSGFVIYDMDGVPTRTAPAVYSFVGAPYVLNVSIPGISPVASQDIYAIVGDDGSNTPGSPLDSFFLGALHLSTPELADFLVGIDWQGPTDAFTGESIPAVEELQPVLAGFSVWQHGDMHPLLWAPVTTRFTAAVPAPATVWLLATGLAGLGGRRWMRRKVSS